MSMFDTNTLLLIGGGLVSAGVLVLLLVRRRWNSPAKNISAAAQGNAELVRIAAAVERIASTVGGGGGDLEALAQQFDKLAEMGVTVSLPPSAVAKMIRERVKK